MFARSRLVILALFVALAGIACAPLGFLPGGRLSGEAAADYPADWAFTADVETVQVETRADGAYSVNTWCLALDGNLYLASKNAQEKQWVQNVLVDPQVRVRVEGKLYEFRIVRVEDRATIEALEGVMYRKYARNYERFTWREQPTPDEPPPWFYEVDRWFFELVPAEPGA